MYMDTLFNWLRNRISTGIAPAERWVDAMRPLWDITMSADDVNLEARDDEKMRHLSVAATQCASEHKMIWSVNKSKSTQKERRIRSFTHDVSWAKH